MPESSSVRKERISRLLRNRRSHRHSFFLSEFPAFGIFLSLSYAGIIWLFATILLADNSDSTKSFVIARFWFQRFVGIANLSAFLSFWVQCKGLVGSNGINPAHKQLQSVQSKVDANLLLLSKYEYYPTLLWLCFKKKYPPRAQTLETSEPLQDTGTSKRSKRRRTRVTRSDAAMGQAAQQREHSRQRLTRGTEDNLGMSDVANGSKWAVEEENIRYLQKMDNGMDLICFFGCLSSVFLILPFLTFLPTSVFFLINTVLYLSLKTIGAEFMQLQWDAMLIEINLCCFWLELDALLTLKWLYLPFLDVHNNEWKLGTNVWRFDSYTSRIGIVSIHWLHYRLMMSAGFVKLSSGCPSWRSGTAMKYHFWTQPIPNKYSFLVWKLQAQAWKTKLSTYGSIVSEMMFPMLLFFPYRICRLLAAINTFGLMFVIFATGNFGFFNVLTASMGVLCFDDALWPEFASAMLGIKLDSLSTSTSLVSIRFNSSAFSLFLAFIACVWLVCILLLSLRTLSHVTYRRSTILDWGDFKIWAVKMQMWGVVNSYGLFARMTTFRHELIIQGTVDDVSDLSPDELNDVSDVVFDSNINATRDNADTFAADDEIEEKMLSEHDIHRGRGMRIMRTSSANEDSDGMQEMDFEPLPRRRKINWKTYEFKYKPGDINRPMPCALFHLPRLDWRMWFLPLREFSRENDKWFIKFIKELMRNNTKVTDILEHNPFAEYGSNYPINAIRVLKYEYRFPGDEMDDLYGAKALGIYSKLGLKWEKGQYWSRRHLQTLYIPTMTKEDLFDASEIAEMFESRNMQKNQSISQEEVHDRMENAPQ